MQEPRMKEKYKKEVLPHLMEKWNLKSPFQAPRLEKIVVSVGAGQAISNPAFLEEVLENLFYITGQKPVKTLARKSIAGFKVRKGMPIGAKVTLRKDKMYEFFDRLVSIVLPRLRDFQGIKPSFDKEGNLSIGIKEHTVFPEINLDKVKNIHGLQITFVTTTKNKEMAKDLLEMLGFPFKKEAK